MDFAKSANFECHSGYDYEEGVPESFGFNFEPKGNFTFTWAQAVSKNSYI